MKPSKYRVYWIASFGAVLVLCTYLGQGYYKLRSVDHYMPLVALSISPELDWLSVRAVEYELCRRIENGDFFGADVLRATLAMGLSHEELRDTAIHRAEWLVADLVDVNSEGITGMTPLHEAVVINDAVMAEQLIRLGADPRVKSSLNDSGTGGQDALDYAKITRAMFPDRDMTAIFEVLEFATESE